MKMTCKDRERIFQEGTAAEWAALEGHAEGCASCAEELRALKSLSVAAAEMRDYTQSPALWPRIHQALAEQGATLQRREPWSWRSLLPNLSVSWRTAAATALVVALMVSAGWLLRPSKPSIQQGSLLKSKALVEVEHAESAYVQAIGKLAIEAKPQIDNPATPLMADYREKLLVLDSAIDDLRAQTGQNASNAHLRYELLAMYQEKQRTLEEILEAKR
jgi:hypothetical protein